MYSRMLMKYPRQGWDSGSGGESARGERKVMNGSNNNSEKSMITHLDNITMCYGSSAPSSIQGGTWPLK